MRRIENTVARKFWRAENIAGFRLKPLIRMTVNDGDYHMERMDSCTTERVAMVAWRLVHGGALTTAEAAQLAGIGYHGARAMLDKMSRVLPIFEDDGQWRLAGGCLGAMPKRPIGDTAVHPR